MTIHCTPQGTTRIDTTDRPKGTRPGKPSKAKPYNLDAGYKCSRKTPFGHAVVYDRESGGEWIAGPSRWVVAAFDTRQQNIGVLECASERDARNAMKNAAAGECGWCDWMGHLQLPLVPADSCVRFWTRTPTGYAVACERGIRHDAPIPRAAPWVVRMMNDEFLQTGSQHCATLADARAVLETLQAGSRSTPSEKKEKDW